MGIEYSIGVTKVVERFDLGKGNWYALFNDNPLRILDYDEPISLANDIQKIVLTELDYDACLIIANDILTFCAGQEIRLIRDDNEDGYSTIKVTGSRF